MICTGHHSVPNIPDFPGAETFKGEILHSHGQSLSLIVLPPFVCSCSALSLLCCELLSVLSFGIRALLVVCFCSSGCVCSGCARLVPS